MADASATPALCPESKPGAETVADGTKADVEPSGLLTEQELALQVCELVRVNSRVSGKAPLAPPELNRHQRLEAIRRFVEDTKKNGLLTRNAAGDPA